MKTQDLISQLAQQSTPITSHTAMLRSARWVTLGLALSLGLVLSLWGVNPHLSMLMQTPAFWVKVLWLVLMCLFAAPVVWQLAHPGMNAPRAVWGLVASVLGMGLLALWQIAPVDPDTGVALVMGSSWQLCSTSIVALSLPLLAALLWMLRGMAPTQPVQAGASAGLMSGALASLLYALHCPETAFAFLAVWYVSGMSVMGVVGALLGRKILRW